MPWKAALGALGRAAPRTRRSPSAILLAFANDWVDDRRHLRSLLEESKAITAALAPVVEAGLLVPPPIHNATVDDVIGTFRARRHRDRIRIFHFSGHAGGQALLFEDEAGQSAQAHASGLADYLGQQRGLVLVFLNGCCTEPQVRRLRAAGVKAVIATTRAIDDQAAADFAEAFYAELAGRPLREAFDAAASSVRLRHGDDPRTVTRDVDVHGDDRIAPAWPWILDCDPDFESWTLRQELTRDRRRTRQRRLLPAVAAMCGLLTLLVLSAQVRRIACAAPGLRSLCAAGSGGREDTPSTVQDIRQALVVAPDLVHPSPTEEHARIRATTRGHRDAAKLCKPLDKTADLLSAHARPIQWNCVELGDGFACGFRGEVVCTVRDRDRPSKRADELASNR
jgi:hypothetical protein